jgi:hypothetical protein
MDATEGWAMKAITSSYYESPSGNMGYRVAAPSIPGCVVIHPDFAHAVRLVQQAVIAVHGEPKATDVSDEIPWWSTTA